MKKKTLYTIAISSNKKGTYSLIPSDHQLIDGDYIADDKFIKYSKDSNGNHSYDAFIDFDDKGMGAIEFKSFINIDRRSDSWIKDKESKMIKKTIVTTYNFNNVLNKDIPAYYLVVKKKTNNDLRVTKERFDAHRKEFIKANNIKDHVITFSEWINKFVLLDVDEFVKLFNIPVEIKDYDLIKSEIFDLLKEEIVYSKKHMVKYTHSFEYVDINKMKEVVTLIENLDPKQIEFNDFVNLVSQIKVFNTHVKEITDRKFKDTSIEDRVRSYNQEYEKIIRIIK